MRLSTCGLIALLLAAPLAHGQDLPESSASAAAPAAAGSTASAPDAVDLEDIRNFSRVFEVVRQAYVEKVDNKTLMKAAISGMLSGLDPHSEYLDKDGLAELTEDTTGAYSGLGIEVIEQDGQLRTQPVFCRLRRDLLESLVAFVHGGGRKIDAWTARHRTAIVPFDRPGDERAFFNANTIAELRELESK